MAFENYVLVCGGTACCSGGGDKIVEAFARELEAAGLKEKVQVVTTCTFSLRPAASSSFANASTILSAPPEQHAVPPQTSTYDSYAIAMTP